MKIFKPASRSQDRPRLGGSDLARNERIESPKLPARKCRRRFLSAFLTRIGSSHNPKGSKQSAHFLLPPKTLLGRGRERGPTLSNPLRNSVTNPQVTRARPILCPRLRRKPCRKLVLGADPGQHMQIIPTPANRDPVGPHFFRISAQYPEGILAISPTLSRTAGSYAGANEPIKIINSERVESPDR